MQSDVILWVVCSALLFGQLVFSSKVGEEAVCGQFFGDFSQQRLNINQRQNMTSNFSDSAIISDGSLGRNELIVNLALLLPSKDAGEGCDNCILRPVLPVIELAIVRAQKMLNDFMMDFDNNQTSIRFRRMYGDTKCSSTVGPLIAVEMLTKTRPDVFIGLICKYVLAPISRYAGVWQIPVITPGGLSEAFNMKVNYLNDILGTKTEWNKYILKIRFIPNHSLDFLKKFQTFLIKIISLYDFVLPIISVICFVSL